MGDGCFDEVGRLRVELAEMTQQRDEALEKWAKANENAIHQGLLAQKAQAELRDMARQRDEALEKWAATCQAAMLIARSK